MKYRNLGATGTKVSLVGIGCNNFGLRCDQRATTEVVDTAIELGINLFDTADVYGAGGTSEEYLGNAIAKKDRSSIVIATKFANPMSAGEHLRGASQVPSNVESARWELSEAQMTAVNEILKR